MLQQSGTGELVTVTDESFAATVLASDRPVVVDFWAEWCPSCAMISKSLVELAEEFGERLLVVKLNADENPETARTYSVMGLPTLLVFRRGEVVGQLVGSRPKGSLRRALSEWME